MHDFKFKIGDIVSHKLDPHLRGLVISRVIVEETAGVWLMYALRVTTNNGVSKSLLKFNEDELELAKS